MIEDEDEMVQGRDGKDADIFLRSETGLTGGGHWWCQRGVSSALSTVCCAAVRFPSQGLRIRSMTESDDNWHHRDAWWDRGVNTRGTKGQMQGCGWAEKTTKVEMRENTVSFEHNMFLRTYKLCPTVT